MDQNLAIKDLLKETMDSNWNCIEDYKIDSCNCFDQRNPMGISYRAWLQHKDFKFIENIAKVKADLIVVNLKAC